MKRILIEAVTQSAMRAPYNQEESGGDWFFNHDGDLVIRVIGEDLADHAAFLFALHELAEAKLCQARGISQEKVDWFDTQAQSYLSPGKEPGDQPFCPYRKEHRQAMLLEHLMASFLGLSEYGIVR